MKIPVNKNDSFPEEQVAKFVLRGVRKMDGNSNGTALASGKIDLAVSQCLKFYAARAARAAHPTFVCSYKHCYAIYIFIFVYAHA